jgi:hypothetical protein
MHFRIVPKTQAFEAANMRGLTSKMCMSHFLLAAIERETSPKKWGRAPRPMGTTLGLCSPQNKEGFNAPASEDTRRKRTKFVFESEEPNKGSGSV